MRRPSVGPGMGVQFLTHSDVLTHRTVCKRLVLTTNTGCDKKLTTQKCQWDLFSAFLPSVTSTLNVMFLSAMHVLTNVFFGNVLNFFTS